MQTLFPVGQAHHAISGDSSKRTEKSSEYSRFRDLNQPKLRMWTSPGCHVRSMARESIRIQASSEDSTPSRPTDSDPFDFRSRARTELWREEIGGSFDNLDTAQMAEEVERLEKRQKLERLKVSLKQKYEAARPHVPRPSEIASNLEVSRLEIGQLNKLFASWL